MGSDASSVRRFQGLFDAYGDRILLYFKRRTGTEAARDGTADTFLVAWRRIDDIPVGGELPWLYGVAKRVLPQQRRGGMRRRRLVEKLAGMAAATEPGPETIVVRNAEHAEVLDAVGRLRPAEQEVLRLATWECLPHSDIGQILGCSSHAVDQRLHRATRHLAKELMPHGRRSVRKAVEIPDSRGEAT